MATETELLRATILALGGACDDLPDNLESTLYKRLIEVCASSGGGGGGGGLPTGGEPYKQLVTDGEGNAVWEDRLAYGFTRVILPETIVTQDNNSSILTPFTNFPVADETYTVVYDGKEYVCKAQAAGSEMVVLGDPAETPFMLNLFVDMFAVNSMGRNIYGFAMSTEGKMSFSLSVIQKVSHKVAPKFLPDGIGYKVPDTIITVMGRCGCNANENREWFTEGSLTEDLVVGAEYTIVLDDVEYKTICKTTDAENAPFVLGNPAMFGGEDTGEPFTLYGSGKSGDVMWWGAFFADVAKITRTVYGEKKMIDPELLPMDAIAGSGASAGGGGTLVVRVNNVQLDENLNVVSGTASHSHTEVYSALASGRNVSYIIEMVMPDYDAATYETRTVRMAIPDAVVIRSNDPNGTEYMHIGDMVAYFQE